MRPKDGLDDLEKGKIRARTGIRTPDNPARHVVAIATALVTFTVTQSPNAFRLTFVKVLWRCKYLKYKLKNGTRNTMFLLFLRAITSRTHASCAIPTVNSVRQSIIHFCKRLAVSFLRFLIHPFDYKYQNMIYKSNTPIHNIICFVCFSLATMFDLVMAKLK